MTQEEVKEEILKCKNNPHYFATKYIKVKNHLGKDVPFSTPLCEEDFNEMMNDWLRWIEKK